MLFIFPKLNLTVTIQEQLSWPASQKPGHKTQNFISATIISRITEETHTLVLVSVRESSVIKAIPH